MKIGTISLGCDKNRVDTEKMLARLVERGHSLVGCEDEADVLIVNTCAFIDKAKEESIDEILSAIAYKTKSAGKKVIVTGCLTQRYGDALEKEFPELDAVLGVADYDEIADVVDKLCLGDNKVYNCSGGDNFYAGRVLTTPYHYAYLKIADGCDNRCTYCAIPSIRGRYRSEAMSDLLTEAKKLADDGVKELILVAQDVTRYGIDFDGKPHLTELVRALEQLDFEWIRLMYLEPEMVDDALLDFIVCEPKVVKYADIPLQHIDDGILKRMNRRTTEQSTRALVKKVKDRGIALRSSFICGFPGESEEAYGKLKLFISEANIDYAGFFEYSREEGTPADKLDGHISDDLKQSRVSELSEIQNSVIASKNKDLKGTVLRALYEDIDYDRQMFTARASFQAPEIDNVVYFTSDKEVMVGEFYDIEVTASDGIDLVGRTI